MAETQLHFDGKDGLYRIIGICQMESFKLRLAIEHEEERSQAFLLAYSTALVELSSAFRSSVYDALHQEKLISRERRERSNIIVDVNAATRGLLVTKVIDQRIITFTHALGLQTECMTEALDSSTRAVE